MPLHLLACIYTAANAREQDSGTVIPPTNTLDRWHDSGSVIVIRIDLEPHTDGATCCTTGVWTTHTMFDIEVDPLVVVSICTNCITILRWILIFLWITRRYFSRMPTVRLSKIRASCWISLDMFKLNKFEHV